MSVGYICSSILGVGLAVFYMLSSDPKTKKLALKLLSSFDDCATFFTFSIQIASIVVLARVDYGLSATAMGDVTVRTTWTVSALTLLPLMYTHLVYGKPQKGVKEQSVKSTSATTSSESTRRNLLFSICWACSIYPTLSRMIESFGPSAVGDKAGDALTTKEWNILQNICLSGTSPPSDAEYQLMNAVGIMSSLLTSLFAITKIVMAGLRRHYDNRLRQHHKLINKLQQRFRIVKQILIVCVPLLSIGLIWSYFRLQSFQTHITSALGTENSDSEWRFGQVVAVIVFLPVIVEALFGWHEQQEESDGEHHSTQEPAEEMSESASQPSTSQDEVDEVHAQHLDTEKFLPTVRLLRARQTM